MDLQKAAIDGFAQAGGYVIVEDFAEAVSGGEGVGKRPQLRRALKQAREQGVPLIVDSLSRLSRDTKTMEELVREYGVRVVSAQDGDITEAIAVGKVAKAQKDRELIGERTKQALQDRKAQGVRLGNTKNLDVAQQRGAHGNVAAKRQKAQEILKVMEEAGLGEDATAQSVADALNRHGIVTRQGLAWNKSSVREPLREARRLLHESASAGLKRNPNFGRFA